MRKSRTSPFLWTTILGIVGVAAVVAWMATLTHCGPDLAFPLFPLWCLAAEALFPMPSSVYYTGALLHWPAVGAVVDLVRAWKRRSQRAKRPNRLLAN